MLEHTFSKGNYHHCKHFASAPQFINGRHPIKTTYGRRSLLGLEQGNPVFSYRTGFHCHTVLLFLCNCFNCTAVSKKYLLLLWCFYCFNNVSPVLLFLQSFYCFLETSAVSMMFLHLTALPTAIILHIWLRYEIW